MTSSWNNVAGTSSVRRMDKALPPVSSFFFPQNLMVLPFLFLFFFFCYYTFIINHIKHEFLTASLKREKKTAVFNYLYYPHKIRLLMLSVQSKLSHVSATFSCLFSTFAVCPKLC